MGAYVKRNENGDLVVTGLSIPSHIQNVAAYRRAAESKMIKRYLDKVRDWWNDNTDLMESLRPAGYQKFVKNFLNFTNDDVYFIDIPRGRAVEILKDIAQKQAKRDANKATQIEKVREESTAVFVGSIKERLEGELTLTKQVVNHQQEWTMSLFTDAEGNQYMTFGKVPSSIEVDSPVLVKFTIYKHEERDGVKVNKINRIAVCS